MFDTSHLFYLGDLNFRLDLPTEHPLTLAMKNPRVISNTLEPESFRKDLKEHDQLLNASRNGTAFTGFREGDFWKFKCSYKYELGKVDEYRYVTWNPPAMVLTKELPAISDFQPGPIEFFTQHIPTLQTHPTFQISPIYCIPL